MAQDYFALAPAEEFGRLLTERIERFVTHLNSSGRYGLWSKLNWAYYAGYAYLGSTYRYGQSGEFTGCKINSFRNTLEHVQNLITNQKPAFDPIAANTDLESQAQTVLANGLLEYYLREKRLERVFFGACELATVFGPGFALVEWDTSQGDVVEVLEDGTEIKDGDLSAEIVHPLDVIYDPSVQDFNDVKWVAIRQLRNRWDLVAQYPELADEIRKAPVEFGGPSKYDFRRTYAENAIANIDEDHVTVYKFFHAKTSALAMGRYVETLADGTVLIDTGLPYRRLPVFRMAQKERRGAPDGYSISYDLLPVQEMMDACINTAVSAVNTFGSSNVAVPKGSGLDVTTIAGGFNLFEYDSNLGPPQALNLTQVPPVVLELWSLGGTAQDTMAGINSVIKGNPEASLKSGSALALVASQAIQFSNALQQSYNALLEDVATFVIEILQDFAKTPRIARIVGKNNEPWLREFTGKDLDNIQRVAVDLGNPLSKTLAGRESMAQTMIQAGFVQNPEQYIQVVTTGKLEPLYENQQRQLMLIKKENENLAQGIFQRALITDQHALHILEHRTVADDPNARENKQLLEALTMHMQEHIEFLKTADPVLLQLIGQQPMGAGPMPQGGAVPPPMAPVEQEAAKVQQANMPNLPPGAPEEAQAAYEQMEMQGPPPQPMAAPVIQ